MLEDVLESAGAVVVGPASTVKAALDLLGEEAIDCAVLDVKLGDGVSVLSLKRWPRSASAS